METTIEKAQADVSIQTNSMPASARAFHPALINREIKVSTITDVFRVADEKNLITLGQIERIKGEGFIKSVLGLWIAGLNEFIYGNDTEKALTEYQIVTLCELVAEKFEVKNLNIADISLIFKQAYSGRFGKLYGRIRPDVIIDWFEQYFNDRCNTADDIHYQHHISMKEKFIEREGDTKQFKAEIKKAVAKYLISKAK